MTTFQTTTPVAAYLRVAHYPSNTYYGSSQAYGTVYRPVTLSPGETVWMLAGGDFVVVDGKAYAVKWELSDKHPFEKVYLPPPKPQPPVEQVPDQPLPPRAEVVTLTAETVYAAGQAVGRGIDYLMEEV